MPGSLDIHELCKCPYVFKLTHYLVVSGNAGVQSDANIFDGSWRWPKTLVDFAVSDARLAAISECPMRRALSYPFRPYSF
jgi:hypothetical protein